ncbi:Uncharacterised protein [Klebsiella quasipneumoniae]|nr:hypothetical protein [Klebsiella pneumoniae]SXD16578.1 Uncharacterised protein [Klebsiella quasipneumoniae]
MMNIEVFGFFRKRVNHDCTYTNILGNPKATKHCVMKQISTKPFSTERYIDGKPGKYNDRNGIWHVTPKIACRFCMIDAPGGQRVKTGYLLRVFLTHHKRSGRSSRLVFEAPLL